MKTNGLPIVAVLLATMVALQPVPTQYQAARPGYRFEFPRDYFSHPDFQTEWWYYTGNLQSADGHRFGFELTFFRSGVGRDPSKTAPWDIRDLYFAHFALSDLTGKKFFHTERTNRSGPGIAGADASQQKVWNGNWSVAWKNGEEDLTAMADNFRIDLALRPRKPPVIHGEKGVSQKSAAAGRASHYFSETRLQANGSLESDSRKYSVTGLAWMDHEFFTQQMATDQVGWDWLSLQLNDDTELMLFHIRRKDGSIDPFSAGTFVDAQGRNRHLSASDFQLEPQQETWTSAATGANYPIHWKIRIPSLEITLEATTPLPSQELAGQAKLSPSYWEGAVLLSGTRNSFPLSGAGYLEMTGYDRPVQMK